MPAILNSGAGGELNPGFGGGGPVATAIAVTRQNNIVFSASDSALSAQTSYGWDQFAGEARVTCAASGAAVDDPVTLAFGSTPGHFGQRFAGTIVSIDTTSSPHSVMYLCKGPLYILETFLNDVQTIDDELTRPGLSFADLVGAESGTLRQLIVAVLDYLGVTYSLGNLADPDHVYGVLANGKAGATDEMTWGAHETAAAFLTRFFKASAGYRLFDSADGNVYLKQTSVIPLGIDDVDARFKLGVDIFGDSQHSTTSIGRQRAVRVTGFDDSSGPAKALLIGSGAGSENSAYLVSSNLIETDAFAAEIAAFWLPQVNRLQELVRLTTPRDDPFGPAQTHYIEAPDGLSVNDTMWLKSVVAEISSGGAMTQHPVYVSGAPA